MTTQDWLNKWNDSHSDVQNTLDFFNEYVSNSGIKMFGLFRTKNTHIAFIKDVIGQLNCMRSKIAYLPRPVEYILASIKQEVNNYEYDVRVCVLSSDRKTPKQNEVVVYLSDQYARDADERILKYKTISPDHKHITARFSQELHSEILEHGPDKIATYLDQILAMTSARGHTRGPNIHEADELIGLLEAIAIKTGVNYFDLEYIGLLDSYKNLDTLVPISDSPQWVKQGNFTQESDNNLLSRSVYYVNTDLSNRVVSDIHLSRDNRGVLALKVTASTHAAFTELKDKIIACDLPFPAGVSIVSSTYRRERMSKPVSITNHVPPAFSNQETNEYILYIKDSSVENLNLLARLLEVILAVDHSANIVCAELFDLLNIHYDQQTQTDKQIAIANVIAAQADKKYRPVWELALAYKDDYFSEAPQINITLDHLMQLFQSISSDNPYYADANFELCGLVSLLERDGKNNYALLQQHFRYAFRSGKQELIDNFYNELCGRCMMSDEKIIGIKGDEDILVALAAQLHEAIVKLNPRQTDASTLSRTSSVVSKIRNPNAWFNATAGEIKEDEEQVDGVLNPLLG